MADSDAPRLVDHVEALAAGTPMLVPSPFGIVGMVFAVASLVPWSVFCVVVGLRPLRLARTP